MDEEKHAGNNAPFSADMAERMRSNNAAASPGVRLQFKSPTSRNLTHGNLLDRNQMLVMEMVKTLVLQVVGFLPYAGFLHPSD
ncbi:casein kinase i isoform delta-like [Phtheirospermum japonicum]|uniref:Casein kinase i isoform delta-like n=1 Tax=Phtheirospermum japonicum TaxID=374723 RepID=A0A830CWS7_9LAMI|nr:casein kinase i isoform delta-like [Phtheirospermum japonicum]